MQTSALGLQMRQTVGEMRSIFDWQKQVTTDCIPAPSIAAFRHANAADPGFCLILLTVPTGYPVGAVFCLELLVKNQS